MSDTYKKQPRTQPLPRAELPPVEQPAQEPNDQPTMVRCPNCSIASPSVGKLGCQTCVGAGWITYAKYMEITKRCPFCAGVGRITNDYADTLDADAKRRENER